eukprot:798313-Prymnesium_polylepis.1
MAAAWALATRVRRRAERTRPRRPVAAAAAARQRRPTIRPTIRRRACTRPQRDGWMAQPRGAEPRGGGAATRRVCARGHAA